MDRLAEERRRGITIDLNFAPLELGSGRVAGIVDVPGHEDFVRTMVAGASGIDVALLVVAADESIMPQTTEHLAVLEHLGMPVGIPVVTKADLVDPEWLELVLLEVAERLAGRRWPSDRPSRSRREPVKGCRSSASALRRRPRRFARTGRPLPAARGPGLFRRGSGYRGDRHRWSGRVEVGDAVVLLPDGAEGRVRSVEMLRPRIGAQRAGCADRRRARGGRARRRPPGTGAGPGRRPVAADLRARRGARPRSFRAEGSRPA